MLIYFSDYDYSIYCIMIDLYFPVINLYSGQSLIYYFFRYDYTVYLYLNCQRLSCTTCIIDLCYLSILFIQYSFYLFLYDWFIFKKLKIIDFHYDFFTIIYLNMTDLYYWVIIHLYYLSILFVSLWLIYTTDVTNY